MLYVMGCLREAGNCIDVFAKCELATWCWNANFLKHPGVGQAASRCYILIACLEGYCGCYTLDNLVK